MRVYTQIANVSDCCSKILPSAWSLEPGDAIDDAVEFIVGGKLTDHGRKGLTKRSHIMVSDSLSVGFGIDKAQVEIVLEG
jgi:ribosome biogenesis SPOUT family RNA methylase Rps3